jgi:hypothetical protein
MDQEAGGDQMSFFMIPVLLAASLRAQYPLREDEPAAKPTYCTRSYCADYHGISPVASATIVNRPSGETLTIRLVDGSSIAFSSRRLPKWKANPAHARPAHPLVEPNWETNEWTLLSDSLAVATHVISWPDYEAGSDPIQVAVAIQAVPGKLNDYLDKTRLCVWSTRYDAGYDVGRDKRINLTINSCIIRWVSPPQAGRKVLLHGTYDGPGKDGDYVTYDGGTADLHESRFAPGVRRGMPIIVEGILEHTAGTTCALGDEECEGVQGVPPHNFFRRALVRPDVR